MFIPWHPGAYKYYWYRTKVNNEWNPWLKVGSAVEYQDFQVNNSAWFGCPTNTGINMGTFIAATVPYINDIVCVTFSDTSANAPHIGFKNAGDMS